MLGVAQQVVEHPGQLVRVPLAPQFGGQVQGAGQLLFPEHRFKLTGHLLQQPFQVHGLGVQFQVGEVEPGDLEKFVDQVFQPLGLVQGDAGVPGPQFGADLGFVLQQGQIADDAGQRGFQVMGQVHDQVVFPLLRFPGSGGIGQGFLPGQFQPHFRFRQGGGKFDLSLGGVGQAVGHGNDLAQVPLSPPQEEIGHRHPAQGQQHPDQEEGGVPHKPRHVVDSPQQHLERKHSGGYQTGPVQVLNGAV